MLIDPTKKLSKEEDLKRLYESTDKSLEKYRLPDQAELEDIKRRTGHQLMDTEFIRRVEKASNGNVWAENSNANPTTVAGFYFMKGNTKKFVCAFDKGLMPEFSIITVDDRNMPVKEKRGWRTVLTRLLETKAMTWDRIKREFGDPQNQVTDRWNANTQQFKG